MHYENAVWFLLFVLLALQCGVALYGIAILLGVR
jgi:hypothetical protein